MKKKVILNNCGVETHYLILSDEQIKLLRFLVDKEIEFNSDYTTYEVLDEEYDWKEI